MTKVTKAVILAAGRGTRFLPFTKAMPKEMLPVVDKPAIQLIVEEVVASGIKDILIVISPDKTAVEKHFDNDAELNDFLKSKGKLKELQMVESIAKLANVSYAFQKVANGSGEAVLLAEKFAQGQPVVMLNGDDAMYTGDGVPVTRQVADCYEKYGKTVLGCQKVSREAIVKYASCDVVESYGRANLIRGIIEKPTSDDQIKSLLAPLGRNVLAPSIYDVIRRTKVAPNGELVITDSFQIQAQEKGIIAYEFSGTRYDLGDKLGYLKATVEFALRDAKLGEGFKEYLKSIEL